MAYGTDGTTAQGDAACACCERPEAEIADLLFWLPTAECWLCGACARVLQALVDELVAGQRSDWYAAQPHQVRGGLARVQRGKGAVDDAARSRDRAHEKPEKKEHNG